MKENTRQVVNCKYLNHAFDVMPHGSDHARRLQDMSFERILLHTSSNNRTAFPNIVQAYNANENSFAS